MNKKFEILEEGLNVEIKERIFKLIQEGAKCAVEKNLIDSKFLNQLEETSNNLNKFKAFFFSFKFIIF